MRRHERRPGRHSRFGGRILAWIAALGLIGLAAFAAAEKASEAAAPAHELPTDERIHI